MDFDDDCDGKDDLKTAGDIFQCQMCGICCCGFGGTYVSESDIETISNYIQCDPDSFRKRYCSRSGSRWVLATASSGQCLFFDPIKACTIHPVKPEMCRAWPFIKTLVNHPENWEAMAGSCPGMKKKVPHDTIQRIVSREIQRRKKEMNGPFSESV